MDHQTYNSQFCYQYNPQYNKSKTRVPCLLITVLCNFPVRTIHSSSGSTNLANSSSNVGAQ